MTTQHPEALRLAAELDDGYPLTGDAISAAAELRRQHARITELESQIAQRLDAADMATASAQGFRDGGAAFALIAAAPAQPAAQQGVAYAALPDSPHILKETPWGTTGAFTTKCWREYPSGSGLYTVAQMRAFADATHAIRASHGQAPAEVSPTAGMNIPKRILHVGDSAFESWYSTYNPAHKADKQRARDAYAAGMGDPLVISTTAQADSVQEDALSDSVRTPLDSLHADAAYLIGRLREGSMPYARVIEIIRERIDAAKAAIRARASHGQAPADLSPTAGMNIAQRILHVGGRNNDAGYVEFGSIQAVEALVRQVLRDLPAPATADSVQEDTARLDWLLLRISGAEFRRLGVHYSGNARRADVDAARKQGVSHDR